jgi:Flp pilus assembly protein TadG
MLKRLRNFRCQRSQRGIAALEFAVIACLMIAVLVVMMVYWRVLQAQQSLTRATGDGARMVQGLVFSAPAGYNAALPAGQANILLAAKAVITQSLQASGLPSDAALLDVQINWTATQAKLQVDYALPPLVSGGKQLGSMYVGEPTRVRAQSAVALRQAL